MYILPRKSNVCTPTSHYSNSPRCQRSLSPLCLISTTWPCNLNFCKTYPTLFPSNLSTKRGCGSKGNRRLSSKPTRVFNVVKHNECTSASTRVASVSIITETRVSTQTIPTKSRVRLRSSSCIFQWWRCCSQHHHTIPSPAINCILRTSKYWYTENERRNWLLITLHNSSELSLAASLWKENGWQYSVQQ